MIADIIHADMVTAMKAGEAVRLSTLRMLVSEIRYKQIDLHRDLTDEEALGVVAKEIKKRREAIQAYQAGNRQEQAEQEQKELEILTAYLPQQLSEDEVRGEVIKLIGGFSDEQKGNFGQVMRVVAPAFKGRADGAVVANIVKEIIG